MLFIKKILLVFLFFLPVRVYATSLAISNVPSTVNQNESFDVTVNLSCGSCGDSYLRGVFYPSGTNYFGLTQNKQGEWIGSSTDRTKYFNVSADELHESSWSGVLKVKSDSTDTSYTGPGVYQFKVGRYTSTSDSAADWSNEVSLIITGPTPTQTVTITPTSAPTSTVTPTVTYTPTPTSTPIPSSTPTPTLKPTITSTSTPSDTPTPEDSVLSNSTPDVSVTPAVLGMETDTTETPVQNKPMMPLVIALLFLSIGCAMLGGLFGWKKWQDVQKKKLLEQTL